MPSVTVQFHMMFDELVDFVADMMRDYSLAVELERFFPTTTQVVTTAGWHGRPSEYVLNCVPLPCQCLERVQGRIGNGGTRAILARRGGGSQT